MQDGAGRPGGPESRRLGEAISSLRLLDCRVGSAFLQTQGWGWRQDLYKEDLNVTCYFSGSTINSSPGRSMNQLWEARGGGAPGRDVPTAVRMAPGALA